MLTLGSLNEIARIRHGFFSRIARTVTAIERIVGAFADAPVAAEEAVADACNLIEWP